MIDCNVSGLLTEVELRAVTGAFTAAVVAIAALLTAYVTKTISQWRHELKWKE